MAGITQEMMRTRRAKLLEELPNYGWDYVKAGMAVGYSQSYAQKRLKKYALKDSTFCDLVLAKRAEIDAGSGNRREKTLKKIDAALERTDLRPMELARLAEVQGKICGWLTETRIFEYPQRQRELSEVEMAEGRKLASLRFQLHTLPGEIINPGDQADGQAPGTAPQAPPESALASEPNR